jgi:hypothetical protein
VARIGRQHIRDGVLTVRQQKTGATLAIPVHPDLAAIIAATPVGPPRRCAVYRPSARARRGFEPRIMRTV